MMSGRIDRSQPIKITIENKLMLDGKLISDKIIEVTETQNGQTVQNLKSSTDR